MRQTSSGGDEHGDTALLLAAGSRYADIAWILLKMGASVSVADHEGRTPLHVVAWLGNTDIAKILLRFGADAWATDAEGRTPSMLAEEMGHNNLAALLRTDIVENLGTERVRNAGDNRRPLRLDGHSNTLTSSASHGSKTLLATSDDTKACHSSTTTCGEAEMHQLARSLVDKESENVRLRDEVSRLSREATRLDRQLERLFNPLGPVDVRFERATSQECQLCHGYALFSWLCMTYDWLTERV